MPERIIFPEFRDELEFTHYPFADGTTLTASNTRQLLEEDTFLDASLYPVGGSVQLYISEIIVNPRLVTIWFSDRVTNRICSTSFDPLAPPDELEVQDTIGRPAGILVSEAIRLSRFSAWDSTTHTFTVQATELCAACVIPTPETGLRGFLTEDGDLVSGDIWLVGDNGVVLRQDGACTVRVDVVGDPLFVRKLCTPIDLFQTPNFLRTINNCIPDEYGDFKLEVGANENAQTIMRINPVEDGLRVEAVGDLVRINK